MAYKCISKSSGKLKKGWYIRNKRCKKAKAGGLSGLSGKRKRKSKRLSGMNAVDAYNQRCGCLKANGRLKKGFRWGKKPANGGSARCIAAKAS